MRIFVNDLSFDGGFFDRAAVQLAFLRLLSARSRSPALAQTLYCSKTLRNRSGCANEMLHVTLASFDRDVRFRILQWLSQRGPFIEDDREPEDDDLFWFEQIDVTEQGLGEAARRLAHGANAAVYSVIEGAQADFEITPLPVVHGLLEEPVATHDVPNIWDVDALIEEAERAFAAAKQEGTSEPTSWTELLAICRKRFHRVVLSDHCDNVLGSIPFYPVVARRVTELLSMLQAIMERMGNDGRLDQEGERLRQTYFVGDRAPFSDESDSNKRKFENEMTFRDPLDSNRQITCFWHGKVNEPKFRVHFEWPVAEPHRGLKVVYVGPKISKR